MVKTRGPQPWAPPTKRLPRRLEDAHVEVVLHLLLERLLRGRRRAAVAEAGAAVVGGKGAGVGRDGGA
eukprot:scaffold15401_cov98-Isochrysis_galbana.AAC.2